MRRLIDTERRAERGSIIVLISVFTVVILAMAALVIDVGAIRDEKRQLQNAADAGALAVAQSCARGSCSGDIALAQGLANANSRDAASAVDSVTYPVAKRVQVVTSTLGSGNTRILPFNFGQMAAGVKGKTVRAAATASWGAPGKAKAIPLAISKCEVEQLSIGTPDTTIYFDHKDLANCNKPGAPGAFNWVDGLCAGATFEAGKPAPSDPGKSGKCLDGLENTDIVLPVFDTVSGSGNNAEYHIIGFAALHITGWRFPSSSYGSPAPCRGNETCIEGTFVRFFTIADAIGGADFGVSSVFLIS